jgi:hypothetical protein
MLASDGMLYGVTANGGGRHLGIIYSYDINNSVFETQVNLSDSTGGRPSYGYLTEYISSPIIFKQPLAQTVCAGNPVSFKVSAGGYSMSTQWQVSMDGGATYSNINGATNAIYSFVAYPTDSGNLIRAIFNNSIGSDTSTSAKLTVYKPSTPDTLSSTICYGTYYAVGTNKHWTTGTYNDTLTNIKGCDSLVVVNLTVLPPYNTLATVFGYQCKALQDSASYQWVHCWSLMPLTGDTLQDFTAPSPGYYQCIVTIDSCHTLTNCLAVMVGIDEVSGYHFNLSPNPTSGSFIITNDYPCKLSLQVSNILGEKVAAFSMNEKKQSFDISDLTSGIYELQISDDKQVLRVLKLVKE